LLLLLLFVTLVAVGTILQTDDTKLPLLQFCDCPSSAKVADCPDERCVVGILYMRYELIAPTRKQKYHRPRIQSTKESSIVCSCCLLLLLCGFGFAFGSGFGTSRNTREVGVIFFSPTQSN
jgi:hypothetical protein